MEDAAFLAELRRYPVVRPRTWADAGAPGRTTAQAALPAPAPAASAAPAAGPGVAPAAAPLEFKEFWSGLNALLARHFGDAAAEKRVRAAFETLHYDLVKSLPLDDAEELLRVFAAEVEQQGAA